MCLEHKVNKAFAKMYEHYFAFEIREKVLNRRSKIVDRRPVTPQKNGAEHKQLQYGMAAVRGFF